MNTLLLFTLALLSTFAYSSEVFTKNIGQVKNQHGEHNSDVLYIFNGDNLTITLREQGFSYEVKKVTSSKNDLANISKNYKFNASIERFDFLFPHHPTQIEPKLKSESYINIYDESNQFENIPQYHKVVYHDIAEQIDIEFIIDRGQFKYNIIAQPEADLSGFFLKINSSSLPLLNQGNLILSTIHGDISENIPFSYGKESKEEVEVSYHLDGRNLYFVPEESIIYETLIIDPVPDLIWNTYFGGSQYDLLNDIALNGENEIYQTGFTMSLDNISTSGAFQENYQGDLDAYVSKFDIDGNILWSTYYAGPQTERVYNIVVDSLDNCYIAGSTFSTTGIATAGVHQQYLDGVDDIFFLKLLSNGQRNWCTYHGGNGHDFITDMVISNDTIFSVGHTTSTNNMSSPGAYLETNTTSEAGHITLFSSSGDFLWGSYFGENGNNSVEGIAVNNSSIFFSGRTTSLTGISTTGVHQESFAGFVDGFITRFNKSGSKIWGSYFGGDFSDKSNDVAVDENGDIYICGDAASLNQISTPGAHQETRLSAEQGFLSKFSSDGQQIWGSYTGGYNTDYVRKIIYKSGFLYLGGQTLSTGEITTANGLQEVKSDGYDVFLQKFDTTGILTWGTYFGDIANEDLSSLALSNNDQIVLSGNSDVSSTNFTTMGVHQESFGGGSSDGFLAYLCQPIKPTIIYNEGDLISSEADEYSWYFESSPLNLYTQSISPSTDGDYFVITTNNGLCPDTSLVYNHSTIGVQNESFNSTNVFPNPTSDYLYIENEGFMKLYLLDINNKVINRQSGFNRLELDLSNLSNGIYLIQIESQNNSTVKKIIKN